MVSDPQRTGNRSGSVLEVGVFLVIVALPLVFTPFTAAPFVDPKLWLLLAGTLAVAAARPTIDRNIGLAGLVFVIAIAVTTVFSVDPWWSLLSTEARGVGLVALAASTVLLCAATGFPEDLRARIPHWLFWTGTVVAVIALITRFVTISVSTWTLDNFSGTMGHRTIVGGFLAAAAIAATTFRIRWRDRVALLVLGSGMSVISVRGGLVGTVVGLALVLIATRRFRVVAEVVVLLLIASASWIIGARHLPNTNELGYSAVSRLAQVNEGESRERPQAYRAFVRAYLAEPIVGSGPQTAWQPYLKHVRPSELKVAGRGFGDTHNIFLEFAVTSGSVGLLAFLLLMAIVLSRIRWTPPERVWAIGAAVAVGIVLSVEPLSLPLVPLLFLTAGLAVAPRVDARPRRLPLWVVPLMVVALVLSSVDLVASSLERFGATYASEPALRLASKIDPWRLGALETLANERAIDWLSGDRSGRGDAERIAAQVVRLHGWHPNTRLLAANGAHLVHDEATSTRWIRDDLALYPNDPLALEAEAGLLLRQGDPSGAARVARRALALDPNLQVAARVLKDATSHR